MICFYQTAVPGLYEGIHNDVQMKGYVWLILRDAELAPRQLSLETALHDRKHRGSFVFSGSPLPEDTFIREGFMQEVLLETAASGRGILWIETPACPKAGKRSLLSISEDGTIVDRQYLLPLVDQMHIIVLSRAKIGIEKDMLIFSSPSGTSAKPAYVSPIDMQDRSAVYHAALSFEAEDPGCFRLDRWIKKRVFADVFNPGFEWSRIHNGEIHSRAISMFPSDGEDANEEVDFCFSVYPVNLLNSRTKEPRTRLFVNADASFCSFFTGLYGEPLQLKVKKQSEAMGHFVFEQAVSGRTGEGTHRLAPEGDFFIEAMQPEEAIPSGKAISSQAAIQPCSATLLCGLSGLEYFRMGKGAFIRFVSDCPACADCFPLPAPSPFGPPFDPTADILTDRTTTSWAVICNDVAYISQARGFELYQTDSRTAETGLLRHEQWEIIPGSLLPFPLVPYQGVKESASPNPFTEELLEEFERTVLSVIRKTVLNKGSSLCAPGCKAGDSAGVQDKNQEPVRVATPSGFLVEASPETWESIYLAKNQRFGSEQWLELKLHTPGLKLIQAFSSSNVFLVVVNPAPLGEFANQLNIQDWNFTFPVGKGCKYGEYRNVMLIKGRRGALYDPSDDEKSLIANPKLWTQAEDFSSPGGDVSQQLLLAAWMKEYCEESLGQKENPYFQNFNKIIRDPDWRGILFLKITLQKEDIPAGLSGITSGIHDKDNFVLHHFGINLNPIEREGSALVQNRPSSLFGLIYYNHPDYHEKGQGEVREGVEPLEGDYDFQILTLKVLFQSSAVQSFESSAQLVVNSLFGCRAVKKDSAYNWIFLAGSCQERDGVPSYQLRCTNDTELQFDSNVLRRLSLHSVEMQSFQESTAQEVVFNLSGAADFHPWKCGCGEMDLFSYGTDEGEPVKGLAFSNLQLRGKDEKPLYLNMKNLRFDVQNSQIRPGSLAAGFRLSLDSWQEGSGEPSALGFLPVLMEGVSASPGEKNWMGLCSAVHLGTLGELAGKLSLTSYLLIAWTVDSRESELYLGLKLPGAGAGGKLLSIQNVLKLSLGQILLYKDKASYLLMISDIAVKLFGLKKLPPGGNTMLYLFGPYQGEDRDLGWFALYNKQ